MAENKPGPVLAAVNKGIYWLMWQASFRNGWIQDFL